MSDALTDRIWVGRLASDGDSLVFDRDWQPKMPGKVRLFSVERGEWRLFLPDLVRQRLKKERDAGRVREALDCYSAFEPQERSREERARIEDEVDRERVRREREEWDARQVGVRRERTKALSREHLARVGIPEGQYRTRAAHLEARHTNCWACKQSLDSRQDLEHESCGWLVCTCGACGCARDRDEF